MTIGQVSLPIRAGPGGADSASGGGNGLHRHRGNRVVRAFLAIRGRDDRHAQVIGDDGEPGFIGGGQARIAAGGAHRFEVPGAVRMMAEHALGRHLLQEDDRRKEDPERAQDHALASSATGPSTACSAASAIRSHRRSAKR